MIKKRSAIEAFLALTDAEKEAEVRRLENAPSRPLTVTERAEWKKVQAGLRASYRKKLAQSANGKGVKVVRVPIENKLLERADAAARREGISRAQLFARGLNAVLG